MEKPYISVVAIARNEEAVVARFINSIREHLGSKVEIVIVDTGSTDKTVEIARGLGAKVYEEGERFAHSVSEEEERFINSKFNDNVVKKNQRLFFYSDARNCADSHANGEWLISIDLHWILTSGKDLEKKLRSLPSNVSNCSYKVALAHSGGLNTLFSTTRIYRRGHGKWCFRIHEVYSPIMGINLGITELTASKISGKPNNYLPHLAYHYYFGNYPLDSPEYARMLYYFAREIYYNRDKYPTFAIELLSKCVHNKPNWCKERSQAAVFISEIVENLEAKRINLISAIALNPIWREPYLRLADIAYKQCDWSGCIGYAEQALKIERQEGALHAEVSRNYTTEPYRLIYVALIQMARISRINRYYERAIENVEKALEIEAKTGCENNVFVSLWREGFRCYKLKGDNIQAQKMFTKCQKAFPETYKSEKDM